MYHFEEQGDAKAVGWISMSDMFMLCSIVMLAVAVCFAILLKKTDVSLTTVKGEFTDYKNSNVRTLAQMKERSALLSKEAGGYKDQASDLNEQVEKLSKQLAATEGQRAHFKNESAEFKIQSSNLTAQLSALITKLNSVQGEFDTYRNVNTTTIADLKGELAALTSKANAVESKRTDLDKELFNLRTESAKSKADSDALIADLEKQRLALSVELARAKGERNKLSGDLNKVGGDREQLAAELKALSSTYDLLQKEDAALKARLGVLDESKKRVDSYVSGLEGTIAGLTNEIGELKPQVAKLKVDLSGANLRIIDLEKLVFEKIDRALLAVTVTAQDVPKDFTLELFVTDPLGNECGPYSSVVFNEGDEIGVLQQSVDFRSGKEGSQKAVFYSMRPVYSRMEASGVYSVHAMIRQNNNEMNTQLPRPIMVNCNVDLPNISGGDAHKVAQLEITSPGYIKKTKRAGQLTANTPYKNMWPWEPVYHFDRTVCDFRISGNTITNFRTFDKISTEYTGPIQSNIPIVRGPEEQRIDSIRNRVGK